MRSGIATSARPSGPSQVDNCHKIVGCPLHIGRQPSLTLGDCYKEDNCHKIACSPLHIGRQPYLTLGDCYKDDNCHEIVGSPLHIVRQPSLTLRRLLQRRQLPKDCLQSSTHKPPTFPDPWRLLQRWQLPKDCRQSSTHRPPTFPDPWRLLQSCHITKRLCAISCSWQGLLWDNLSTGQILFTDYSYSCKRSGKHRVHTVGSCCSV